MTLHDQIRRDQSLVLRDSLLGSSFSWLTIVVAVLLAASLRSAPVIDEAPGFLYEFDERLIEKFVPIADGAAPMPTIVPPTQVDGRLVPVDDALLRETQVPSSIEIAEPATGPLDAGKGHPGSAGTGPLEGASGPTPEVIPDAGTWIYRDVDPEAVTRVTPLYPELARLARLEGRLVVRAFVGPDGRVQRAEVESGPALFADAATAAVARWVFTPALANGHPVGVWVRVPVLFRLD